ncbi:hypothetical protein [Neolewinella lacunae]|uniref:hypothetical protein n=1 Tax=Neolewinella lacunae TaxID=1517758 RepID=UPI001FEB731A|nr:hypothetical protein [Neolewinella lacunae]
MENFFVGGNFLVGSPRVLLKISGDPVLCGIKVQIHNTIAQVSSVFNFYPFKAFLEKAAFSLVSVVIVFCVSVLKMTEGVPNSVDVGFELWKNILFFFSLYYQMEMVGHQCISNHETNLVDISKKKVQKFFVVFAVLKYKLVVISPIEDVINLIGLNNYSWLLGHGLKVCILCLIFPQNPTGPRPTSLPLACHQPWSMAEGLGGTCGRPIWFLLTQGLAFKEKNERPQVLRRRVSHFGGVGWRVSDAMGS